MTFTNQPQGGLGNQEVGQQGVCLPPVHHRGELFLAQSHFTDRKSGSMLEFQKQLAYELIENDYLEKEEAAMRRRSTRIQEGIGHGLLSLPPFKKVVGTKVVTSMSKYPQKKCNYCKREVSMYCRCTPGVHLCSHCLAEHIHDADNDD